MVGLGLVRGAGPPVESAAPVWHCRRCPQVLGEIVPAGIRTRIRRERDRHQRVIVSALPCTQTCPSCGTENTYSLDRT